MSTDKQEKITLPIEWHVPAHISPPSEQASTVHSNQVTIDTSIGVDLIAQDAFSRSSYSIEELDELEWDNIVSQPGVQRGLSRLAADIRRQIAAGEIEEGGFAGVLF